MLAVWEPDFAFAAAMSTCGRYVGRGTGCTQVSGEEGTSELRETSAAAGEGRGAVEQAFRKKAGKSGRNRRRGGRKAGEQ